MTSTLKRLGCWSKWHDWISPEINGPVRDRQTSGWVPRPAKRFLAGRWNDVLEVLFEDGWTGFAPTGLAIDGDPMSNLVSRAYHLMKERYGIGGVTAHLHGSFPWEPVWAEEFRTERACCVCSMPCSD